MINEDNKNNIAKLQWACRRGMLELDVLLGNFLEKIYPNLPATEQALFIKLLDFSDPELFAWLLGQGQPEDPGLKAITEKIRHHAHSKF